MISNGKEVKADFIRKIIAEDMRTNKYGGIVHTRFPPEPNGCLHIGNAMALCLNFEVAEEFNGKYNLRFDDTNPVKEEVEYIDAIKLDIKWLGFDWEEREYYASDYFDRLYEYAIQLTKKGKAYVCDLSQEEIREYRGTLTSPGKNSPYRNRSVEDNLDLIERMRVGEFKEGACTLRVKIDMSSPNINMRDPVIYRILFAPHHRTEDKWCIYPTYDFTHGYSDSIERITHSLCSHEFENHRPLYDWFLDELEVYHSRQIEFARLEITHTVTAKRKLRRLVEEGYVAGWDDPRMPSLAGMRRRGYTPEAIRTFLREAGVSKAVSTVDYAFFEFCQRKDLNRRANRVMAVLRPLKVVIDNYPEGKVEELEAENNPEDPSAGTRRIPFSGELYIERDDFMENPPTKYFRLSPGREIRLKHAYYIKCIDVVKDEKTGDIVELHCTYDPASRGGWSEDGRKVRGTSHWVSAGHSIRAEVRLYDHLFTKEHPEDVEEGEDFTANINPHSLQILNGCRVEPGLKSAKSGDRFQFLRQGYFCVDPDTKDNHPVFNKTVVLVDTWAKIKKKHES